MGVFLSDRQGVDVGAYREDGPAASGQQSGQHARRRRPTELKSAELGELIGDELGRAFFVERQLGRSREITPPADHLLPDRLGGWTRRNGGHIRDYETTECAR